MLEVSTHIEISPKESAWIGKQSFFLTYTGFKKLEIILSGWFEYLIEN